MEPSRHTYLAWTLRLAAVTGLVTVIGIGCTLDRTGRATASAVEWTCSVTIRNAAGETLVVRNTDTDPGLTPRAFITDVRAASSCPITDQAGVEDDFQRWAATVPFRFRTLDGPWCVVDALAGTVCRTEDSVVAPTGSVCETPLPAAPAVCETGERCIVLEPDIVDFEAILTALDGEGRSPVGFPEPRVTPTVEVRNSCPEPVRVYIDDQLQGANASDFAILANGCAPRPGTGEEMIGRELLAGGTAGDACTFDLQFTPMAHRQRVAEKRFSQDTTELYTLPIAGRGRGGNLQATPPNLCFDALVGPRGSCTNATAPQTVMLENIGFGRLTVEDVRPTGAFQVSATATPFTLEVRPDPGASRMLDVWWCGDGATGEDDASLIFTDNGVTATTEVLLARRAAGCP